MFVAMIVKLPAGGKFPPNVSSGYSNFVGTTAEKAGSLAEQYIRANNLRVSYPNYRVLIGELTLETVPPEDQVEVRPFKG